MLTDSHKILSTVDGSKFFKGFIHLIELPGKSGGKSAQVMFVDIENKPIASAAIHDLHKESPYIASVHVHKELRGQGLGTWLIRYCVDEARYLQKPRVLIWVDEENPDAQRLYERLGFEVTGDPVSNQRPMCKQLKYGLIQAMGKGE